MAEEERDEQAGSKKKGGALKWILIIVIVLVVLVGGGLAAFMFLKPAPQDGAALPKGAVPAQAIARAEVGPLYPFETFIVNLADPGGSRYLKVTMQAELSTGDEKFMEELTNTSPKIRDTVIEVLSSKAYDDISSPQGKLAVKQELLTRLNRFLTKGQLTSLYITEFVVQ